jgi:hypothetical protein
MKTQISRASRGVFLALVAAGALRAWATDPLVVIDANFAISTGSSQPVRGTQLGLNVNLPGASWIAIGGWDWSNPSIPDIWSGSKNMVDLGEEKAGIAVAITNLNSYVKPVRLTASGSVSGLGGSGVGFWAHPQPQMVVREFPYSSEPSFTGITVLWSEKALQVFANGVAVGPKVTVALLRGTSGIYPLQFTVDTTSGALEEVLWDGSVVLGLSSSAFTDTATSFFGTMSKAGCRTQAASLKLTEAVQVSQAPILSLGARYVVGFVGQSASVSVSAAHPVTSAPLPVYVATTNITGGSISGGVFSWMPSAPGTYEATFSATNGTEFSEDSTVFRIYRQPDPDPSARAILNMTIPATHDRVNPAGTTWTNAALRTSYALDVNLPGSVWIWGTGWAWAVPTIEQNSQRFGCGDERAAILLSLASSGGYAKPSKMIVSADIIPSGECGLGFWSAIPDYAPLVSSQHFTGIMIDALHETARVYENGTLVGPPVSIDFVDPSGVYTLKYMIDTTSGTLSNVTWDGRPVDGLASTAFTGSATSYVGTMVGGNMVGAFSRLSFSKFTVSDVLPSGTVFVLR